MDVKAKSIEHFDSSEWIFFVRPPAQLFFVLRLLISGTLGVMWTRLLNPTKFVFLQVWVFSVVESSKANIKLRRFTGLLAFVVYFCAKGSYPNCCFMATVWTAVNGFLRFLYNREFIYWLSNRFF